MDICGQPRPPTTPVGREWLVAEFSSVEFIPSCIIFNTVRIVLVSWIILNLVLTDEFYIRVRF